MQFDGAAIVENYQWLETRKRSIEKQYSIECARLILTVSMNTVSNEQIVLRVISLNTTSQAAVLEQCSSKHNAFVLGSGRVKKVQRVKKGHIYLWYLNPGPQCVNGFWHRFFP